MSADWLYPLSSKANYWFELADGTTTPDTSPSSFEQMIHEGGADDTWGAHRNWKRAEAGDRVWVYYGTADGDLGVVALARIKAIDEPAVPGAAATVHLRWARTETRRLLRHPYPAAEVRRHIPRPLGAMWRVEPPLADALASHARTAPTAPPLPPGPPNYATGVTSTINYVPPRKVTVERRHDALLRPMMTRLETAGWKAAPFDIGARKVDLAMKRGNRLVLVEAKTVKGSTREPVRAALAQLLEYQWRYEKGASRTRAKVVPWALFEKQPNPDEIEFLEDQGVQVTWADSRGRRFFHGPGTAAVASKLGL